MRSSSTPPARGCSRRPVSARPLVGSLAAAHEPAPGAAVAPADLAAVEPLLPAVRRSGRAIAAHILFTSGSTGAPKGVLVTHANVIAFVEWARQYFGIAAGDRVSGHSPLHFDLSTFDIYGALPAGAVLHLVASELSLLPPKLGSFIRESRLTQWFSVPSAMNLLARFDAIAPGSLPDLERVIWCGEVLPTPTLDYWMERVPHATFTNLYGPTETTIASSYHRIRERPASPTEPIPIGTACPGEELLVLDAAGRGLPPGREGDLYIGGVGVTTGYWRDEERTRQAFVPDPRPGRDGVLYRTGDLARVDGDGLFFFLGRRDSQIKSRGHRIELGEVEAAVSTLPVLEEHAVVAVLSDGFDGVAIGCAYATPAEVAPACAEARAPAAPSRLHDPDAVAAVRAPAEEREWQDRPDSDHTGVRRSQPWHRIDATDGGGKRGSDADADAEVVGVVTRILRESLYVEVDDPDVDLIASGLLDSLALVELLLELERTLGRKLQLEELEVDDFRSVARIARFVETHAAKAPPRAT